MQVAIAAAVLCCIALVLALALCCQSLKRGVCLPVTVDWIEQLSLERYHPMLRLLNADDIRSVRSQPGCTRAMLRGVRHQRCEAFHRYLHSLEADFQKLVMALKLVMVQSERDHSSHRITGTSVKPSFLAALSLR